MATLSVVIINFNTKDDLRVCLTSLYDHPPSCDFEVLVVDNASGDGSAEMVATLFPQASLIVSPRNLGFAGGNNVALRRARGEAFLLLNPDTVVLEGAVDRLMNALDEYPQAGVVGGKLLNPDGSIQASFSAFPTLMVVWGWFLSQHCSADREAQREAITRSHANPMEVEAPIGAFFLVRRTAVDDVGLLDEGYFVYAEEIDWCFRMRQKGWRAVFYPRAELIHKGGASSSKVGPKAFIYWIRSHRYFHRKHYGWLSSLGFDVVVFAEVSIRILRCVASVLFSGSVEKRQELGDNWAILGEAFGWRQVR